MERLNELYRKRRAWAQLFDLLSLQVGDLSGAQQVSVLWELAQLAADRLHRPENATRLYRQLLELDETRVDAIDALEKHAERNKDWDTLAFVLERRTDLVSDPTQQSAILQKLGAVYLEHLQDVAATVRTWRRVLTLQPGHPRALRVLRDTYLQNNDFDGLTELYGSQNDWDGLGRGTGQHRRPSYGQHFTNQSVVSGRGNIRTPIGSTATGIPFIRAGSVRPIPLTCVPPGL